MVFKVAGGCAEVGARLTGFVKAALTKTGVGVLIVRYKIEMVLDQQRTSERVIADAVAADPRIRKRECEQKEQQEHALGKRNEAKPFEQAYVSLHKSLGAKQFHGSASESEE